MESNLYSFLDYKSEMITASKAGQRCPVSYSFSKNMELNRGIGSYYMN